MALAANWLAGAWDQNSGLFRVTPATAALEQIALGWLLEIFGLPATCAGAFVTGTTVAHITALAAARHAVLERVGWNVEADGLFGAPPNYGRDRRRGSSHPVQGAGSGRIRTQPGGAGSGRQSRAHAARGACHTCRAQLSSAPRREMSTRGRSTPTLRSLEHARQSGAWVHVDGAFGLWAAATPSLAHLYEGIAEANSWATDAHKWLNVPYDSGLALVRDCDALRAAMAVTAEYLPTAGEQRNPSDYTPELSRRARGVEVWAALRALGRSGLADLIERTCRHAQRFAEGFSAAGYAVLNEVTLNQVLVSFGDAEQDAAGDRRHSAGWHLLVR